ncbi:vanadium-dependent haloperoxidase [Paraglaciecola sp.]|uniref:vanadium-dependent haloperoxidase n=1 Tax=Paraglaciecola sp. TaxID=1920173 RepID=UPI0030F47D2E
MRNIYRLSLLALCLITSVVLTACGSGENEKIPAPTPEPLPPVVEKNPSVARQWNEVLLSAIRNDFARPTVHARNLFHVSSAMYDAWTAFTDDSSNYLLGKTLSGSECKFAGINPNDDTPVGIQNAREEAISYAAYKLIYTRFALSPDKAETFAAADTLMANLGYNMSNISTDYSSGSAAALGNHIAECYLAFGAVDGSKEDIQHGNTFYQVSNNPLDPIQAGNPNISHLNRWQSLDLGTYIDQSGNVVTGTIEFLGAEWGAVAPFSLSSDNLTIHERDDNQYYVYHDPGMPPTIEGELAEEYEWNFSLVSKWSSHLDPNDGVMMDISPKSQGNINIADIPHSFTELSNFYKTEGGDIGTGYNINPATGESYTEQLVPRGDYARVLAEFWADGPDSETPPGHWFVIMNEVFEHPEFERKFEGQGKLVGELEWDVKSYFVLGGTMHDAAIAAWGIKGWYDYIRPISSIRAMADLGQRSDMTKPNFHPQGLKLETGLIELIETDDPLAGYSNEQVGKIKLFAWKGPEYIANETIDMAGVGWILAENWWPYQRPSFVTPPFAGFVSGHSTYSRAAAEMLTLLTGNPYFPGGMSGFYIKKNEFLVFEEGPSVDMVLQWATYRDASDQCSLSRIWGGIHPPADDIPGRLIGEKIGKGAYAFAKDYFEGKNKELKH